MDFVKDQHVLHTQRKVPCWYDQYNS